MAAAFIHAGAQSFGADFTCISFSDVSLRVQVFDPAGNPLRLHLVPEPDTLMLFALTSLRARRRAVRRDRVKTATNSVIQFTQTLST